MEYREYMTSNSRIAYPFREDSAALVGGLIPLDFLVDAFVLIPFWYSGQVHLVSLEKTGQTVVAFIGHPATILLAGELEPGSAGGYGEFSDEVSGAVFRYVRGASFAKFLEALPQGETSFDFGAPFEGRASVVQARRVKSVQVRHVDGSVDGPYTGVVEFSEGYNIAIDQAADLIMFEESGNSIVSVAAGSGLGIGREPNPDCQGETPALDYLAAINKINGDDGNFTLECDPCYRIFPAPSLNTLWVYNDCMPCCECTPYIDLAKILKELGEDYSGIKTSVETQVSSFNSEVTEFNERIADRKGFFIRGMGTSGSENDIGRASGYSVLSVELVNFTRYARDNVVISFDVENLLSGRVYLQDEDHTSLVISGNQVIVPHVEYRATVKLSMIIKGLTRSATIIAAWPASPEEVEEGLTGGSSERTITWS